MAIPHSNHHHHHPSLRLLRRQEIDTAKWDGCIDQSHNGLLYGYSFYLDAMAAGQWDALIDGDYEAVMPLTWRSRAGIRYLYQPAFTQQTGIFSATPIPPERVAAFLDDIHRHYRFSEIYLNYANEYPALEKRINFILPLTASYEELSGNYKKDLVRNLKAAARMELHYRKDFDLVTALADFRHTYARRLPHVKEADYRHFEALCILLQQRDQLLVRAVTGQQGQPLCSSVLLRDKTRFYLLHSTTLPAGRTSEANHFLLDQFIREWAGSPFILDFEGSDLPGIAHFYQNFGSIAQPYFFHRHNHLPWPLRWLK